MNYIEEYNNKIQSGEIITSKKVKLTYKALIEDLNDPQSKYEFSERKAQHAIFFIEHFCKHSKGKWADKPVLLELWQKAYISSLFGVVKKENGKRRFRETLLIVGKKNGKSLLASAISLYMLIADGEGGAECYSVATKREQAKIIFTEAERMVKKSPLLRKFVKCRVNLLSFEATNSVFRPLSSDSNTEDGLNISCADCDEIHAWQTQELYKIVADGVSAREEPLILLTTTAGFIREGLYDDKYEEAEKVLNGYFDKDGYKDDAFFPVIYELDRRDEWQDEKCWIKANPNLNISKSIEYLRRNVEIAKELPINLKNVLTKEFNIRETSSEVWLTFEEIDNTATFDISQLKPRYAFGGVDLSKTTDLTSACLMFMMPEDKTIYVQSMFWLPSELFEKRIKDDKMKYEIWYERGLLRKSNGNKVDYDDVIDWFCEMQRDYGVYLYQNCYDSWSSTAFIKSMDETFGKISRPVIQGKKTLSLPMHQLGEELKSKNVNYNNNPILKWNMTNVRADIDKNGNIQPTKTMNSTRRIDGFAAMLNAYVGLMDEKSDYIRLISR